MPEMKAALGTQADMTVFRKLAPLDHLTSYSHRGSYYTLRSIPRFNEQGIWLGRGAWFSRHGTLLDTIPVLVQEAAAGYLAGELETVLHVPVKDALQVALWFAAFAGHTVTWRGQKLRLRRDGTVQSM